MGRTKSPLWRVNGAQERGNLFAEQRFPGKNCFVGCCAGPWSGSPGNGTGGIWSRGLGSWQGGKEYDLNQA